MMANCSLNGLVCKHWLRLKESRRRILAMKKLLELLLCAALLLAGFAAIAQAEDPVYMTVWNCREWVSLRKEADTSSTRLAKVPLNAQVVYLGDVFNGFVYCEYQGKSGYILKEYIRETDPFELLPKNPTAAEFQQVGTTLMEAWSADGKYFVTVQRAMGIMNEYMCMGIFDASGRFLTSLWDWDEEPGPEPKLDAFLGGAEDDPRVLWYNGITLSSHRIEPEAGTATEWILPLDITGTAHAVDTDGTIYIIDYFEDILYCITPDGHIRWALKQDNEALFGPYQAEIKDDTLIVTYEDSGNDDGTIAFIVYDKDGIILDQYVGEPLSSDTPVIAEWGDISDDGNCLICIAGSEEPMASVLFSAKEAVRQFRFLQLEPVDLYEDEYSTRTVYTLEQLTPEQPLMMYCTFIGDVPNNGFAYVDEGGEAHVLALDISGEDGTLIAWPITEVGQP